MAVLPSLLLFVGVMGFRREKVPSDCWTRIVNTDGDLVVCLLGMDVSKINQRYDIALVPSDKETKELLLCFWHIANCPAYRSDYGLQPLGNLKNALVAHVPANVSQDSYKYQLIPVPDTKNPYNACEVIKIKTGPRVHVQGADGDRQDSKQPTAIEISNLVFMSITSVCMVIMGIFMYLQSTNLKQLNLKNAEITPRYTVKTDDRDDGSVHDMKADVSPALLMRGDHVNASSRYDGGNNVNTGSQCNGDDHINAGNHDYSQRQRGDSTIPMLHPESWYRDSDYQTADYCRRDQENRNPRGSPEEPNNETERRPEIHQPTPDTLFDDFINRP